MTDLLQVITLYTKYVIIAILSHDIIHRDWSVMPNIIRIDKYTRKNKLQIMTLSGRSCTTSALASKFHCTNSGILSEREDYVTFHYI